MFNLQWVIGLEVIWMKLYTTFNATSKPILKNICNSDHIFRIKLINVFWSYSYSLKLDFNLSSNIKILN